MLQRIGAFALMVGVSASFGTLLGWFESVNVYYNNARADPLLSALLIGLAFGTAALLLAIVVLVVNGIIELMAWLLKKAFMRLV